MTDEIKREDADEIYGGNIGLAQTRMWNSLRCKWKFEELILNNLEGKEKDKFSEEVSLIRDKRITSSNKSRAKKLALKEKKLKENLVV